MWRMATPLSLRERKHKREKGGGQSPIHIHSSPSNTLGEMHCPLWELGKVHNLSSHHRTKDKSIPGPVGNVLKVERRDWTARPFSVLIPVELTGSSRMRGTDLCPYPRGTRERIPGYLLGIECNHWWPHDEKEIMFLNTSFLAKPVLMKSHWHSSLRCWVLWR